MKNNQELVESIIKWIDDNDYNTYSISIGQNRSATSYAIAEELKTSWQDTRTWIRVEGGFIIRQVSWPEVVLF